MNKFNQRTFIPRYRLSYISYDDLLKKWDRSGYNYMDFSALHKVKLIRKNIYQFIYKIV